MFKKLTLAAASAAALTASTLPAQSQAAVEAGLLTCTLEDSTNAIVVSNAVYSCVLDSAGDRVSDGQYTAQIQLLGVALNFKADETLQWAVLSLTDERVDAPIAGNYVGASANVAVGLGVGGRLLVGGLDNSFGLQPASVAGQKGLGVSVGVERLRLTYVGPL